jgi:hypothetical protein
MPWVYSTTPFCGIENRLEVFEMSKAEAFVATTPGELLVVFREGTDPFLQQEVLMAYHVKEHLPSAAAGVIQAASGREAECIRTLIAVPSVQFVQPHHHIGIRHSRDTGH